MTAKVEGEVGVGDGVTVGEVDVGVAVIARDGAGEALGVAN